MLVWLSDIVGREDLRYDWTEERTGAKKVGQMRTLPISADLSGEQDINLLRNIFCIRTGYPNLQ